MRVIYNQRLKAAQEGTPFLPEYADLGSSLPDNYLNIPEREPTSSANDNHNTLSTQTVVNGTTIPGEERTSALSPAVFSGKLADVYKSNIEQLRKVRMLFFKVTEGKIGV
jgi:hypothetical protein